MIKSISACSFAAISVRPAALACATVSARVLIAFCRMAASSSSGSVSTFVSIAFFLRSLISMRITSRRGLSPPFIAAFMSAVSFSR